MIQFPADSVPRLFVELIEKRGEEVLKRLVRSHNNGTITAQEALAGIAEYAGLTNLLGDLDTRLKRAQQ